MSEWQVVHLASKQKSEERQESDIKERERERGKEKESKEKREGERAGERYGLRTHSYPSINITNPESRVSIKSNWENLVKKSSGMKESGKREREEERERNEEKDEKKWTKKREKKEGERRKKCSLWLHLCLNIFLKEKNFEKEPKTGMCF